MHCFRRQLRPQLGSINKMPEAKKGKEISEHLDKLNLWTKWRTVNVSYVTMSEAMVFSMQNTAQSSPILQFVRLFTGVIDLPLWNWRAACGPGFRRRLSTSAEHKSISALCRELIPLRRYAMMTKTIMFINWQLTMHLYIKLVGAENTQWHVLCYISFAIF